MSAGDLIHRRGLETHTLYLKHVSLTFRLFWCFSGCRFKDYVMGDRLYRTETCIYLFSTCEKEKKNTMALDPAVGRVLMHAELIGRVGLLVLQGNYKRSEHQFYKLLFH